MTSADILPSLPLFARFGVRENIRLQDPCLDVIIFSPCSSMEIATWCMTQVVAFIFCRLLAVELSVGSAGVVAALLFVWRRRPMPTFPSFAVPRKCFMQIDWRWIWGATWSYPMVYWLLIAWSTSHLGVLITLLISSPVLSIGMRRFCARNGFGSGLLRYFSSTAIMQMFSAHRPAIARIFSYECHRGGRTMKKIASY